MAMITVTKENFDSEVLKAEKSVVLDFWAPWCGYCRRIAPALDKLEKEYDLIVGKLNIDEQPELTERFKVETIPTLIVFQKGEGSKPIIAPETRAQVEAWLKENGALD